MNYPFDNFDIIYYINLDSRLDRKESILHELQKMNINITKIKRIAGVVDKIPALGCYKAHLNCLYDFKENKYNNCLIFEDDFIFNYDMIQTYNYLNNFFANNIEWDVIMISYIANKYKFTNFDFILKLDDAKTASGYGVNKNFLDTLLKNYEEGSRKMSKVKFAKHTLCNDQYWKILQPCSNWFGINPTLGHQKENYSDIQKKIIDGYADNFGFIQPHKKNKILFKIITNENENENEIKDKDNNIYYVIENKLLNNNFIINEHKKIIQIKSLNEIDKYIKILFPNN